MPKWLIRSVEDWLFNSEGVLKSLQEEAVPEFQPPPPYLHAAGCPLDWNCLAPLPQVPLVISYLTS